MKAAVLRAAKTPFAIEDLVVGNPGRREVLVRVAASGLCHSDYHFINGDLPFAAPSVLGHEAAGVVESIGSDVTTVVAGGITIQKDGTMTNIISLVSRGARP